MRKGPGHACCNEWRVETVVSVAVVAVGQKLPLLRIRSAKLPLLRIKARKALFLLIAPCKATLGI